MKSTVAKYYNDLISDFKTNEKKIMKELDQLQSTAGRASSKGGDLGGAMEGTEEIRQWQDHMWDRERIEKEFHTNFEKGLTSEAAKDKLVKEGLNELTDKKKVSKIVMFLAEQTGFFSLLLWFGAFLCFLAYIIAEDKTDKSNLYLGIVLAVVVFLTGVFSYMQSSKAASLMDDFKNMIPKKSDVMRDGKFDKIDANTLVPGDVVRVEGGQQIPADLIIFDCTEMKVNNASLTGEAEELLRLANEKNENVFESANVAFFGTECKTGKGTGIVFRTGDDTAIGRIANLTSSAETK